MYVGSFNSEAPISEEKNPYGKALFEAEQKQLLADLYDIPQRSCDRKVKVGLIVVPGVSYQSRSPHAAYGIVVCTLLACRVDVPQCKLLCMCSCCSCTIALLSQRARLDCSRDRLPLSGDILLPPMATRHFSGDTDVNSTSTVRLQALYQLSLCTIDMRAEGIIAVPLTSMHVDVSFFVACPQTHATLMASLSDPFTPCRAVMSCSGQ